VVAKREGFLSVPFPLCRGRFGMGIPLLLATRFDLFWSWCGLPLPLGPIRAWEKFNELMVSKMIANV
jgi:hypothetical protein